MHIVDKGAGKRFDNSVRRVFAPKALRLVVGAMRTISGANISFFYKQEGDITDNVNIHYPRGGYFTKIIRNYLFYEINLHSL